MSIADDPARTSGYLKARRRAIFSAWAGFGIDSYSIYIATSVLVPVLAYFQGTSMSAETKGIFAGMTLAATLLGRPLGSLIFGHFADRLSRRTAGTITIVGFGVMSLLIACLPGAETVGATVSTTLLIALRFIEGIFLGGEYTAATPLALEYAPARHRGFIGALIQCASSGGGIFVAGTLAIVLVIAPAGDVHAPYAQWGWRIPFIVGFVLAILVAWFLRRNVDDSETWKDAAETARRTKAPSPLRQVLRGRSGRAFVQAYLIMTGVFFFSNLTGSVLGQFLLQNPGFTPADLANTNLVIPIPGMAAFVLIGWLSDHIGRKRAIMLGGALGLVIYPIVISLIGTGATGGNWLALTLLAVVAQMLTGGVFGVVPSYINERFATSVRSSGWGVAYSTAVIVPALFSYYMVWLGELMPFVYTAGVLAVIGGAIIVVAATLGPETRGIDLRKAGFDADAEPVRTGPPVASASAERKTP